VSGTIPTCQQPGYLSEDPGLDRLLDNLQAQVPGLTNDMAMLVAWNVIEDFYVKSAYRREHVYFRMDPGVMRIDFDPYDSHWRVSRFMKLFGLNADYNFKIEPPGGLRDLTYPPPTSERVGEVILALKPNSISTPLPYDVWTTYWETLLNGALHRLYLQPGKPYSDMNASQAMGRLYRSGIASARADAQSQHLRDGQPWVFPYFARGGHPDGRW